MVQFFGYTNKWLPLFVCRIAYLVIPSREMRHVSAGKSLTPPLLSKASNLPAMCCGFSLTSTKRPFQTVENRNASPCEGDRTCNKTSTLPILVLEQHRCHLIPLVSHA